MTQLQEFFLQGSVPDSSRDLLIERLRGLANPGVTEFKEHELVFSQKVGNASTILRVRRSLDKPDAPWHLRYVSNPEPDSQRTFPTMVRRYVDSLAKSDDLMTFLKEIGFRMDYEYLATGNAFTKGPLKIIVSKIHKVEHPGDPQKGTEHLTDSSFVEVSTITPFGENESIGHEIKTFADQLRPLVQLDKFDFSRQFPN